MSNQEPFYEIVEDNIRELIRRWYVDPLRQMTHPDYGFIILMILFPLYEKHLRVTHKLSEKVSEKGKVVKQVAKDLKITEDVAYILWNHYRNGLLHRGMPKNSSEYELGLVREGPAIKAEGKQIHINPFAIRDLLLPIIEADRSMWKDAEFPLAVEFRKYREGRPEIIRSKKVPRCSPNR